MTIKGTVHGPYYGCYYEHCREEQCWPPEDLYRAEKVQGWVCYECWHNDEHGTDEKGRLGESLAVAIQREINQGRLPAAEGED